MNITPTVGDEIAWKYGSFTFTGTVLAVYDKYGGQFSVRIDDKHNNTHRTIGAELVAGYREETGRTMARPLGGSYPIYTHLVHKSFIQETTTRVRKETGK
jgi:hypothetical protein|tara:strand:- start:1488 stop:1787 length:300 start_codon:yes stop_codon:yes gene_type:complete